MPSLHVYSRPACYYTVVYCALKKIYEIVPRVRSQLGQVIRYRVVLHAVIIELWARPTDSRTAGRAVHSTMRLCTCMLLVIRSDCMQHNTIETTNNYSAGPSPHLSSCGLGPQTTVRPYARRVNFNINFYVQYTIIQ